MYFLKKIRFLLVHICLFSTIFFHSIRSVFADDLPTFYIRSIILDDDDFLSKKERSNIVTPHLNHYLSAEDINGIIQQVKSVYIQKGYPTVVVKIPLHQNLSSGMLTLQVIHGFIERIIMDKDTLKDRWQVFLAFPYMRKRFLHLKDLEQGIDQLNSLSSNTVSMCILPGRLPGSSIIQITRSVHSQFRVDTGTDNFGESNGSSIRWKSNLSIDNLFISNDTQDFRKVLNN
ncbi:POTRA domain-containing protein [Cardinium endosymbiont of Culicoides punctatus]|uniref:POTRA domain-containing protein n=1 Tax=Cardinium endosymbiont of Culicoides punctatus TaxID=2304601 RepID=UPI00105868AE|nr:POTRA domain-containing protein [Cardinium endosymbiont of Culicoides punctatus]TDG93994.1 Hemolysin transporter protein ShlB [Cardinium endosymbiont of Culicoides punctatus]